MLAIDIKTADGVQSKHWEGADQAAADLWLSDNKDSFPDGFVVIQTDITAQVAEAAAVADRSEARQKCALIIDMIAALNNGSGASDAQMDAIFSTPEMVAINLALLTGAPATAARKIAAIGTQMFSQAQVDQIVAQLNAIK